MMKHMLRNTVLPYHPRRHLADLLIRDIGIIPFLTRHPAGMPEDLTEEGTNLVHLATSILKKRASQSLLLCRDTALPYELLDSCVRVFENRNRTAALSTAVVALHLGKV